MALGGKAVEASANAVSRIYEGLDPKPLRAGVVLKALMQDKPLGDLREVFDKLGVSSDELTTKFNSFTFDFKNAKK